MAARWTLIRAARLGYLAGRGLSVTSIMADDTIAARSERAVRVAASRWRLPIGGGLVDRAARCPSGGTAGPKHGADRYRGRRPAARHRAY